MPDKDDSDKDATVEVAVRQMSQNNHLECPEAEERMEAGLGGSRERMTWGKVGRQAPQGRDTDAGQRKSRLSAQLNLILVKTAPPASAVGSRSRAQLNPNGNGHMAAENREAVAYKGGGLSKGATHGSLPSSASYSQTPLVAHSPMHRSQQGWSLGGSLNDVHPAAG